MSTKRKPGASHPEIVVKSRWTDDNTKLLIKLYEHGLSMSQIALRIGWPTRNAVCGKISRLGLIRGGHVARVNQKYAKSPARQAERSLLNKRVRPASAHVWSDIPIAGEPVTTHTDDLTIPHAQRKSLMDLEPEHCKFPIGDPKDSDFFFCGGHSDPGLPYCKNHTVRAYRPPEPRKRGTQPTPVVMGHVRETV